MFIKKGDFTVKRKILMLFLCITIFANHTETTYGKELSKEQRKVAENVAEIATDGWQEYGILPSVAVAQTFVESSLGVNQVRPNNLWGLRPKGSYATYKTFKDGMYAYLNVLNNGRYDKALYKKDYRKQLSYILQGGYYGQDDGGTNEQYYNHCVSLIRNYKLDKYDKKLFAKPEENKRKKKWKRTYTLVYDETLRGNKVKVDESIIKKGVIKLWKDNELKGIYDVTKGQKGFYISVFNPELDGMKVKIEVLENAKG